MSKKKTTEEFVAQAMEMHGDVDTFGKVDYKGNKVKVCFTCKEHGDYWMTPNCYLNGQRCPECGKKRVSEHNRMSQGEFLRRVREVHGDKYDFSKAVYKSALEKVEVICPKHGSFWMTPSHLFEGHGCAECAKKTRGKKKMNTYEEFVEKANKVHNSKYTYHNDYVGNKTKIRITCPIHGDFHQRPDDHLSGKGCPRCGHTISKAEDKIYDMLLNYLSADEIIRHDTDVLNGLEIDIYLPNYKLGIEYNGLRWHSEEFGKDRNYHLNKTELAASKGVDLIQIFEDEWLSHEDLVLEKLCHFIGKGCHEVIGARKCTVCDISKDVAMEFLEKYHIQGFVGSSVYLGAYYGEMLAGVMTFTEESAGKWNLTRFSTDIGYSFPGLASKMFRHFVSGHVISEVKTFLDRRWSHGDANVYDKMGFRLIGYGRPDYRYVDGYARLHKFRFRKDKLHRKYGLPLEMTEYEMTKQLGFYRIWDCGLIKYVWSPSK